MRVVLSTTMIHLLVLLTHKNQEDTGAVVAAPVSSCSDLIVPRRHTTITIWGAIVNVTRRTSGMRRARTVNNIAKINDICADICIHVSISLPDGRLSLILAIGAIIRLELSAATDFLGVTSRDRN